MRSFVSTALSAIFCLFFVGFSASAQTSVYGSVDLARYGYSVNGSNNGQTQYSYYNDTFGVDGGATYLFPSSSRLKAGADFRGVYSPGTKGGGGGFASFRVAFVPRTHVPSPYFQIGGVGLYTHEAFTACTAFGSCFTSQSDINGGAADVLFGLNIRTNSAWSTSARSNWAATPGHMLRWRHLVRE